MDELVNRVSTHLTRDIIEEDIHLPYADGRARAWLFEQGVVESETQGEDGSLFHLRWNAKQKAQFEKSFGITRSAGDCCDPCCGRPRKTGIKRHGNIFPQTP